MNADGVDILNEANGNNIVVSVAYDLKFKLFPAADAFLDQHLTNKACLQTAGAYYLQFIDIVYHAAACAAHSICGTQNNRIFQLFSYLYGFINGISDLASRHLDAKLLHGVLELDTVLTALDRVNLHADDLHVVLLQHACFTQLGAEVQTGLTAEVRQKCVRALFFDDLCEPVNVQRLDVGDVGNIGVRHDRRGVGIHQNDLIAKLTQSLARLGA